MSLYPTGNPARMGRRVGARAIDVVLSVAVIAAAQVGLHIAVRGTSTAVGFLVLAVLAVWTFFGMWTLFARAATPGQFMLGLHHVDQVTGLRAGPRTFLKYVIESVTLGASLLITLVTIQEPNRSWFDRVAGVTLVDPREPDPVVPGSVEIAAPPAGWEGEESHPTQLRTAREHAGVTPTSSAMNQPVPFPVLTLDSGEVMPVDRTIILGRAPRPDDGLEQARLIIVADPSVSANHLAVGLGPAGPWAMDLDSTNGSSVQQDGGPTTILNPLVRVPLSPGALVRMGQRSFSVDVA